MKSDSRGLKNPHAAALGRMGGRKLAADRGPEYFRSIQALRKNPFGGKKGGRRPGKSRKRRMASIAPESWPAGQKNPHAVEMGRLAGEIIKGQDARTRLRGKAKRRGRLPDWRIVELLARGESHSAIARMLGRSQTGISLRASQLLGLSGSRSGLYSFGQPVLASDLRSLKEGTGLFGNEFAVRSGLPQSVIETSLWKANQSQRLRPKTAKQLIAWRDEILGGLLKANLHHRGCTKPSILRTLVPYLREYNRTLCLILPRLRTFLRDNPGANSLMVLNHLCEEAVLAKSPRDRIFRSFLPCACGELAQFIGRDLQRIRGSEQVKAISCDWLAGLCHTKPSVVNGAVRSKTRMVSPTTMRALILSLDTRSQYPASSSHKKLRGQPANKREKFIQAGELHDAGLSWSQVAQKLSPGENPQAEGERLRKGLYKVKNSKKAQKST